MKQVKRFLRRLVPLAFWLGVWVVCYHLVDHDVLLASPVSVAERFVFVGEAAFWNTVGMTLLRTGLAYLLGVALGCVLAVVCHLSSLVDEIIRPAMRVIRSTPVASFIILALVWLSSGNVPILAGMLMVLPVVFANVREGIESTDRNLLEMAKMFRFSHLKTWRHVYWPSVMPNLIAASEACVGLCFKATIAAEVIGTPKNAIGTQLYNAKIYLENDVLLAWTIVVILLSTALEWLLRRLFRGLKERRLRRVRHA